MGDALDMGAKKRAQQQAKLQDRQLKEQQQKEQLAAAEAEDETARRRAVASKGGFRGSLLTGAGSVGASGGNAPSKTLG